MMMLNDHELPIHWPMVVQRFSPHDDYLWQEISALWPVGDIRQLSELCFFPEHSYGAPLMIYTTMFPNWMVLPCG